MARGRPCGGGNMHARLGEVDEHMETAHYKKLTARLQQLKQIID
jgi:hypothetical protein